jgi:tetratricopeptide (TPR) repeat protein
MWQVWVALGLSLLFSFIAYGPALNGEFLFDDSYLPFLALDQRAPLQAWLGVRPLLMFSYWLNYQAAGLEPFAYHATNVVLHAFGALLIWLIARRLLRASGEQDQKRTDLLAGFAGALFLLHPVQTEAVAYVAGRSEALSVLLFLAAFAVFLYRPDQDIRFGHAFAVLALFGAACTVKEHTITLLPLLLLADFYFKTPFRLSGIIGNYRLYLPAVLLGALAVTAVLKLLAGSDSSIGFRIKEFTWYEYFFTQLQVIWTYLRLYILPVDLNGDYMYPVSRSILEPGTLLGGIGLAVLAILAWMYRRKYPLASFGFFAFLLLLSPTSSFMPIKDLAAERRLYLPFLGLLLITLEFLRRWRASPSLLAGALVLTALAAGALTYSRSQVWSHPLAFWSDVVEKSPNNARAHFQLGFAQWQAGQCSSAAASYAKVASLQAPDDRLLVDWGLALDCLNRPDEAAEKLRQAAALRPGGLPYAQIGMIYGKRGRNAEALAALEQAEKLDPGFDMTYVYRGNIYLNQGDAAAAVAQYQRALAISPNNSAAQQGLAAARRQSAVR